MPPPTPAVVATAVETATVPGEPAFPAEFQALGTEPFWSVMIDGGALTYATPENQQGSQTTITRSEQSGVLTVSGTLEAKGLQLVVTPGQCSDGMSDTVYPYSAALSLGDERFAGCARVLAADRKR